MNNPVTDKPNAKQSRTLGFSFLILLGVDDENDFGWKNMFWSRLQDPQLDWASPIVREQTGFRICRNKS